MEIKELVNKYTNIELVEENNFNKINVKNNIDIETLLEFTKELYQLEEELSKEQKNNILFNLKGLDTEKLGEVIKYSLTYEDLKDSLMILNIINLIKINNTLDDSFFDNPDVYITDIEQMLDLKYDLVDEINDFIKKLSIYFISLFKSYNKVVYTPLDVHKELPSIYKNIFLSSDLLTISGIFSVSNSFSTEECIYIDKASQYIVAWLEKSMISINFMESFLRDFDNGDNS